MLCLVFFIVYYCLQHVLSATNIMFYYLTHSPSSSITLEERVFEYYSIDISIDKIMYGLFYVKKVKHIFWIRVCCFYNCKTSKLKKKMYFS